MSTLLGCLLIGEHPFWTSFAPIAIIRLDEVVTATRDVDCIMSTVIGALLGWLIFSVIDNTEILYISVIILVFLCFSSIKVNYAVSIFFITVFIIVITSLGQGIAESWSIERVVGTTTGVAISFVVVFIQSRLIKTDKNTQGRLANLSAVKT